MVAFDPQLANARLTAATAIVGTVSDTNLDSWVLDRAPARLVDVHRPGQRQRPGLRRDPGHVRPDRAGQRAVRPPPDRHRHRRPRQPDDDRRRGRHHDQAGPVPPHRDRPVGGPGRLGVQPGPLVRLADGRPVGHVRLRLAAGRSRTLDIQTTVPPTGHESTGHLQPVPDRHPGLPDLADRPARRLHLRARASTRSTG